MKKRIFGKHLFVLGFIILVISLAGMLISFSSDDPLEIIRQLDQKQYSETSQRTINMIVYPESNNTSNKREFQIAELSKGNDYSYMEFQNPKSIKGLKILSIKGDNWVYFPSTGRVRKIAGKSKSDSVQGVGGDFSYEDLGSGAYEEKYTFKMLKNEKDQWILEGTPKNESSYSKIILYVDKNKVLTQKIEFYSQEGILYKELILSKVKVMGGKELPTVYQMTNVIKKTMTLVTILSVEHDIAVDEKYFNPSQFYK